jgi:hypothetical protein
MRILASTVLALMTAISAMTVSAQNAEAHRYRGGAIAFGVASAVVAGIALSRYNRHYYSYYDDYPYYNDDYYYAPRRYYSYGYYGPRVYGYGYYPRARAYAYGWGHRHYRAYPRAAHWRYGGGRHWRRY